MIQFKVDRLTKYTGYQKLFRKLNKDGVVANEQDSLVARLPENEYKNRYYEKVPLDDYRVKLEVQLDVMRRRRASRLATLSIGRLLNFLIQAAL